MKILIQITVCLLFITTAHAQNNTINPIIGDESFVRKFQTTPDATTNELLRIQTHLSYVEAILRIKDLSHLNKKQKRQRAIALDLLHQYWTNGIFPKNYDYEESRRPCFIDRDGNICAVGYLIEKTAGRKVAEQINKEHQYDYLLNLNEEAIENWATQHGLTLEECAMIQPQYGYMPTDQTFHAPIKTGYGISSGFVGGMNLGINLMNLGNRNAGRSKTLSYAGLISGTSQIVLGLTNIRKDDKEYQVNGPSRTISYKSQNNLSYINIATGTTTVLTSAVNLFVNRRIKDKRNALNLYSYPELNNKMVTGIAFTRTL